MLLRGPSCGHDFDFHLLSWLEASTQFAHFGYPRWAFTPAWNAGEPRFVFYPPLSWTLGALLGRILPWALVPAAYTWVCLTLSGLTALRLARRYASPTAAMVAATLYLANPYMLFTAYERTAYGELLAAAWLPLLFAAALPLTLSFRGKAEQPASRPSPLLPIATALALLWLTNAPAAVMGSYALAILIAIRIIQTPAASRLRLAASASAGTVLGLALAAFYIVPAASERRFVQIDMAVIEGMRVSDHFLFHRMSAQSADAAFHDTVVRSASFIALSILAAIAALSVAYLARARRGETDSHRYLLPLTLLIAFLLTPPSLILWTHTPQLAFLQFPWRLVALLSVILLVVTAQALDRFRRPALLLTLPCLLILPGWQLFRQACDGTDALPARVALFHSNLGTEATDEYTPAGADADALKPHDPPYWLAADADSPAPLAAAGPAPNHLTLSVPTPEFLVLNRRRYPLWQVRLNGVPSTPTQRTDGLIAVALPAGIDTIELAPIRTPDETIGLSISFLAALAALTVRRKKLTAYRSQA